MSEHMYRRAGKVLGAHRKLVLYRYENGLAQVREDDQQRRAGLLRELESMRESVAEGCDVDADELESFLYCCLRNCPPGDVLLMNETMYGDELELRLKDARSDLGELGLDVLAKLQGIVTIQYEVFGDESCTLC